MDYGIDTNRTFGLKELLIFTDYLEIPQTQYTRQCNVTAGQYPCLVKGCYTDQDICNGRNDCEDGFDESDCGDSATWQQVNISGNVLLWSPFFFLILYIPGLIVRAFGHSIAFAVNTTVCVCV